METVVSHASCGISIQKNIMFFTFGVDIQEPQALGGSLIKHQLLENLSHNHSLWDHKN